MNYYSLQRGEPSSQAANPPGGMRLVDWTGELHDFADNAALVANLDLVVSVDTSMAHLAGGARQTGLAVGAARHRLALAAGREDSPWYPTLRVFRQPGTGRWPETIARLADCLGRYGK